jgi:hypothetical protein
VGAIRSGLTTDNGANIDFMDADGEIAQQHYAFLVGDSDFDEIFGRIRERTLPYWADPAQSQQSEINHHDGGRGVYFEDPNGHLLEVITHPMAAVAGIPEGRACCMITIARNCNPKRCGSRQADLSFHSVAAADLRRNTAITPLVGCAKSVGPKLTEASIHALPPRARGADR